MTKDIAIIKLGDALEQIESTVKQLLDTHESLLKVKEELEKEHN